MQEPQDFDLACIDTLTRSQQCAPMEVINYRTGLPMRHADGTPVTVTLLGRASDVYREMETAKRRPSRIVMPGEGPASTHCGVAAAERRGWRPGACARACPG
jgi:hypothetical protein